MAISILLVDDSKFVRKGIAKELPDILRGRELIFSEACNGNEALELLYVNSYDIVFLDLTMPEKTGYQVLEALKDKGIKANIIVLTADVQPESERIVRSLGAAGYMEKQRPLNRDALMKVLQEMNLL
ncbi:MAG: response regulator [Desulfamplus sp.]|nr:response regulator [Desulfamplus sp.]MBF0411533.1 response regulator [Desulfamplus sp.]